MSHCDILQAMQPAVDAIAIIILKPREAHANSCSVPNVYIYDSHSFYPFTNEIPSKQPINTTCDAI